jgi:predicted metal-binding membrane protein
MSARRRGRISTRILFISAVAWLVLLVSPASTMSHAHQAVTDAETAQASLPGASAMKLIPSLMAGWALMLVAMMSPTLIAPIWHIIERSFKRRRARSVTLFVIGYAAIWMAAGVLLIATTLVLNQHISQSYVLVIGAGIVAVVWQCSPMKQRCLNRSHSHRALAAFGPAADLDVLQFGIAHGVWCVGSCWVLMLLPMIVSYGHIAAMAVVTFVMIDERLETPKPLSWRLRPRGKLMRIMIVQTPIQLQRALIQQPDRPRTME